jgi:FlaA1/EpsC-like NDP-sugar epimerase
MIEKQNVLVTGGAGSVGRALISRMLAEGASVVRIFDNNEPGLAELKTELADDRCRFLVGDVRDKDRLARAMQDIDIVVHTAAMKHVDISEYNPFEAVKTNVLGLQNVIDAAIDAEADRLVFTSSDKAVDPANTMGTTKLLGEKLVTAGNKYSGPSGLVLAGVRFGNVLNSSQSVVPRFHRQIRDGGPVTVTDGDMSRFFLTYTDIADLVTTAVTQTEGGEVFVRKMDAIRIGDLAEAMIDWIAPQYGHDPEEILIEHIGPRLGETMHEKIMTEREATRALESPGTYAIPPETEASGYLSHDGIEGYEPAEEIVRSSEHAPYLSPAEIIDLLQKNGMGDRLD